MSDRVLDLEKTKAAQAKEIANLKKRVKKLERKRRSKTSGVNLFKIGTSRRRRMHVEDQSSHRSVRINSRVSTLTSLREIKGRISRMEHRDGAPLRWEGCNISHFVNPYLSDLAWLIKA
nr:hypothetical protein [Tanacetum cinerariifolium]